MERKMDAEQKEHTPEKMIDRMSRKSQILFFTSALLPIFVLIWMAGSLYFERETGITVRLPISGYDPRDLLSGHYLIYRVDYPADLICEQDNYQNGLPERTSVSTGNEEHCLCIETLDENRNPILHFVFQCNPYELQSCRAVIRGNCDAGRFLAGIERYHIPENRAKEYDQLLREKGAEILISVSRDGKALVKELIFPEETQEIDEIEFPGSDR